MLLGRQFARAVVIALMTAGIIATTVRAQSLFEKLVSPGPVIAGHAKLEKDCGQCHEPFSRKSQTRLCLACHEAIAADRRSGTRFHGRQSDAARQECTQCHTDHKGREFDIVLLDRETFNHVSTNFELRDAHRSVPCGDALLHIWLVLFGNPAEGPRHAQSVLVVHRHAPFEMIASE